MAINPIVVETLERPLGASFFLIVSYQNDDTYFELKSITEKKFSKSVYESSPMPKWELDDVDRLTQMPGKSTKILSFLQRIHREELVLIKRECVEIQSALRKKDPTLRLIPGYLTSHNVVISQSKDDFHRVYLFQGVYSEIIYVFRGGKFSVLDTAPGFFKTKESVYFFNSLHESYEYNKFKS
ncbi:hypothetical protein LPTSP3_g18070 [Leptospira kobayashii]|uniref:PF14385 domain protein n=1 Tax=Leptospira kobayashii TaxID=1917830 RepID=A0ABM7UJB6_9LEPT|nr:DUF4416 family protein [Leptospira kobayashii]BDA78877.1 hypothetical protein LPTSP3_g18070 [Leptospira kobayashii]